MIADELLRGEVYLRDVIDTKPIGIFWIYAGLIKFTGGAIPLLRLAASLIVAGGAWGLYLAGRKALGGERAGIAAGLIYCVITSLFTYYGVSPNTEIFFNLFTIAAIGVVVAPRIAAGPSDPLWHWPIAGMLLGLAMIIKPFAAAEALAVGLFMVWFYFYQGNFARIVVAGALLLLGFMLPIALVYAYYANQGMLYALNFYLFDVNGAYPIELPWYLRLKYIGDYCLRFSPFIILGALALVQGWENKRQRLGRWTKFLFLGFIIVTVVVLITGKRFGHYQVQLHPMLAALAGAWYSTGLTVFPKLSRDWTKKYTPALLMVLALAIGISHYLRYSSKEDIPMMIARSMRDRLPEGETFFGLNGWQITYHLLDREVPTPYVHSSLLFLDHHVKAFQIDELAEADKLLANPKLTYLLGRVDDEEANTPLSRKLLTVFIPIDTLEGKVVIYQRKN